MLTNSIIILRKKCYILRFLELIRNYDKNYNKIFKKIIFFIIDYNNQLMQRLIKSCDRAIRKIVLQKK